jgi:hypothetical protein
MQKAVEKIITRTADKLAYPRLKHLCTTCGRYIRSFCSVGMEITHGEYYQEYLSKLISPEWGSNETIPNIIITIVTCTRYKRESRRIAKH